MRLVIVNIDQADFALTSFIRYAILASGHSSSFGLIENAFVQRFIKHWKNNTISPQFIQYIENQSLINKHIFFVVINTDHSGEFVVGKSAGEHWVLSAIIPGDKKVYLIDSAASDYGKLTTYALGMAITLIKSYYKPETLLWSVYIACDIEKQINGFDCGVHVCMNAENTLMNTYENAFNSLKCRYHISDVLDKKASLVPVTFPRLYTPLFDKVKATVDQVKNQPDFDSKGYFQFFFDFHINKLACVSCYKKIDHQMHRKCLNCNVVVHLTCDESEGSYVCGLCQSF